MASELDGQIRTAVNDARRQVYGPSISVILLKENGNERKYDEGPELTTDFMVSNDKTGNVTLLVVTNEFDDWFAKFTHISFRGWVFEITEPSKPGIGPGNMKKYTGRHMGHRYEFEP